MKAPHFGGGHGAFTYSVLKGSAARRINNDDRAVEAGELIQYVQANVSKLTNNKQHPRDFGNMANADEALRSFESPASSSPARKRFTIPAPASRCCSPRPPARLQISPQAQADIDAFQAAIAARHILPDDPGSAWNYPRSPARRTESRADVPPGKCPARRAGRSGPAGAAADISRAARRPQVKTDFENGAKYMEAAARLTPESLYLQARDSFFSGPLAVV